MTFVRKVAAMMLPLLLICPPAGAQSERGNVTGLVTDPTGAAIAGAEIQVINTGTNETWRGVSGATGEFNAPNLLPGAYRTEVSAQGFRRFIRTGVVVAAAGTARVEITLTLGQVSDQVEVSAAVSTIQTENAKVSTQVQNKLVDELPLVVGGAMRSPFNLVAVVPEARGSGAGFSLGGGQAGQWDATLDGHSVGTNRAADTAEAALNTPSVEALTEFTVDTNGFKAEYGQAGGGVMTFASKSGTNKLHGSAYDFLRNDKMDARGFFARTRSIYRQNDFGGTVSGPVVIPKLYNGKDKTFFFVSFEGFRNRVGANATILSVPTAEMFKGDFTNWVDQNNKLIPVYDPATTRANPNGTGSIRDVFAGNVIPAQRFSQTASSILPFAANAVPNMGAVPGTSAYVRNNYQVLGGTTVTPTDKWSAKGDHLLTSKQRVSFLWNSTKYRNEPGPAGPPGLPVPLWSGSIQAWDTSAYRISHDWTVSSRMVNHASFATNTFSKNSYSANVDQNWANKVCIKNAVDCNQNFPTLNFTEYSTWGSPSFNGTEQPGWGFKDDLSWIRGSHSLKFGFQLQDQNANGFGQQDIAGRADFNFLSTSIPGSTSFPAAGGSSFASFLLGDAYLGRTETIRQVPQKYRYYGLYAQDDWRISRKLVLNYGLRFDTTLPPVNSRDEYSDFDPTRPNPGAGNLPGALIFAGNGAGREGKRTLVPGWYGGWGPRLGIAYTPGNRTTFRAGYGRSFSRVTAAGSSGHFAGFIGQYVFENTSQGVQPTFRLDQGLPAYKLPPLIDPSFSNGNTVDYWNGIDATRAPESNTWTFNIQHQLTSNLVLEVGYNGSAGSHLPANLLSINQVPTAVLNSLISQYGNTQALALLRANITSATAQQAGIRAPYAGFTGTVAQALRPFPQYLNIITGTQGNGDKSGHSTYHAFVLKADRRFSRGLTFQWNYLFSKLLTDTDTYAANQSAAMDQYNRRIEKSIGQFDQTHALKFSTIVDLPFGKGQRWVQKGVLAQVIGGWRVSAIQVYSSGFPIGLTRNNPLPIFNGTTRPYVTSYEGWRGATAGDKFDPAVDRFMDRSVFPTQATYFGNSTRYNPKVRAFWNQNENVSLAKTFNFGESLRLDLRGEAFNIFNRTVFGIGSTNIDAATFGVVTNQVNDPRQMQVALKLYW